MTSFIAALLALFALWFPPVPDEQPPVKFLADAPHEAPAGHAPSMPASTDSDRPTTPHSTPLSAPERVLEPAPPGEAACEPGEEWQGEFGCVAVQLDGERTGRAYG